jgi:hypothetical protein
VPEWVIVTDCPDGDTLVLTDWQLTLTWTLVGNVRAGIAEPAVFADRWRAKRVLRRRNMWRCARLIPRERL